MRALSFELFPEAVHLGGLFPAAAGLLAGGATFVLINTWLDSRVARRAGDPEDVPAPDDASGELSGAEAQQSEKVRDLDVFLQLKRKYDPSGIISNRLYEKYLN